MTFSYKQTEVGWSANFCKIFLWPFKTIVIKESRNTIKSY